MPIRNRVDGISLFPALHKASGYGKVSGEDDPPIHSLSYDSLHESRCSRCRRKKMNEKEVDAVKTMSKSRRKLGIVIRKLYIASNVTTYVQRMCVIGASLKKVLCKLIIIYLLIIPYYSPTS